MTKTIILLSLLSIKALAVTDVIIKAANTVGVDSKVLKAICWVESSHNPKAINYNDGNGHNSMGLCQVQYPTAKDMGYKGTKLGLLEPYTNAYYAAKYLKYQLTRYKDIDLAILAYNAGSIRYNKKGLIINFNYLNKVKKALKIYE